jgi:CBS domain-containing protein
MSYPVVTVGQHTPLREVAHTMLAEHIGAVPVVVDGGRLCGIVTESDIIGREVTCRSRQSASPRSSES